MIVFVCFVKIKGINVYFVGKFSFVHKMYVVFLTNVLTSYSRL
jgi:hypothetical protein